MAALVHSLEVHQLELEVLNQELAASNDELQRNNAALAVARDRYSALHELAPIPLITVDVNGTIREVNSAAESILGTPRAYLIDGRFVVFVAEAGRAAAGALLRELFVTGRARRVELVLATPDHLPIEVVIDAVVIGDDGKGPAQAVLSLVDVTARKRAEAAPTRWTCVARRRPAWTSC